MRAEEAPTHRSIVSHFLTALVSWVCDRPRLVLAAAALLCAVSVFASASYLQYHTQRSDLISPHKDYQQRWRSYLAEFGDDDDIVVVVQGNDRKRMAAALDTLAGRVEDRPEFFDRLFYKVDLRGLRNRALMFLPVEAIQPIQDNLKTMGSLLAYGKFSWSQLTLLNLLREARHRAGHITPDKPLSAGDDQFLTQLLAITKSASATLGDVAAYKNPWSSLLAQQPQQKDLLAEPQYFFSEDGTLAFLLVHPLKEAGSFTAAQKSVAAMRAIVAETRPGFADVEFGLTGLPVLETDEMMAAERDTRLASWLAIAGVTLLFILVYRGIWYPLLTVTTLLVGTVWAMGWLTLTVGHLNILSATFAVMLIGMGDYGVLWVMRYEQARKQGADVRSALMHTTTHVAIGNLTAAATLALAFYAAMLADFQAVAELGWIAGSGVLMCAFACFTVLPSLLMIFDKRPAVVSGQWSVVRRDSSSYPVSTDHLSLAADHSPRAWLPGLSARPRWVIITGLALTLVLGIFACRITYDHNLLHLQARDLDSVRWELTLIEHTAGASWHALSYTSTPEEAIALKARYEQLPEVSRVVEIASLVPRNQDIKLPMLADIHQRLANLPERGVTIPHGRPDLHEFKTELTCLIGQVQPLTENGAQPLLTDLRSSLQGLQLELSKSSMTTDTAEARLQLFDQRFAGDLAEDLHRLRDVSTPAPITLTELPADLRARYIGQTGKWLLQVYAKKSLWDFEPLQHFTQQIVTVDPDATGKPFSTVEGLRAMKNGFQWAGLYAMIAIVLVLFADFHKPRRVLLAVIPLAMGVLVSVGIMGLFGLPLNPANMIAFPLILGVGVDNGVHVLHDYLIRRRQGQASISYAIGRGVLVKAMTTMIGFGMLMISSQRGLIGLGFILTLGVGCCMLTSLVFLPAVLHAMNSRRRIGSRASEVVAERRQLAA